MCREKCKFIIAIAVLINTFEIDFHTVPRLRMSGAIPLLPLHTFMVWTEKPLPSPCANLVLDNYVFQTNLPQNYLRKSKKCVAEKIKSCLFYS